jgi:hypothetical protein
MTHTGPPGESYDRLGHWLAGKLDAAYNTGVLAPAGGQIGLLIARYRESDRPGVTQWRR